ncbi:MAG: rod shape-determining protein [Planctomycetaceae bacterium]
MLDWLRQRLSPDLAIDLGTANTLIGVPREGIMVDEPSVVALEKGSKRVLGRGTAVGKLARQMLGRTPDSTTAVRPLRDGVITDFALCEEMLRYFIRKAVRQGIGKPRVIIAVPGGITPVEKRAVFNSAERAGAGKVFLIEESRAAGIGAGLPISEPLASMICDIGGGTTEVAIMSLGDIVVSKSIRVAGDTMDQAIVDYMHDAFSLRIGMQTAEQLKIEIGSAYPLDEELTGRVSGLDTISGIPRKALITSEQIREALNIPLDTILKSIRSVIEQCQPELVSDLADTGLVLAGGGALIRGIDRYMREHLGIPVTIADDPRRTVTRGVLICLDHLAQWREGLDDGQGDF